MCITLYYIVLTFGRRKRKEITVAEVEWSPAVSVWLLPPVGPCVVSSSEPAGGAATITRPAEDKLQSQPSAIETQLLNPGGRGAKSSENGESVISIYTQCGCTECVGMCLMVQTCWRWCESQMSLDVCGCSVGPSRWAAERCSVAPQWLMKPQLTCSTAQHSTLTPSV